MTADPTRGLEQIPIDDLRPDPANPHRISEDELDALERSLREFGFVQPVLARREDRAVIGDHQRLVAARRLGLTSVPVIWLDLGAEQARLLGLALNRISGSWDDALLACLLTDLQANGDIVLDPLFGSRSTLIAAERTGRICADIELDPTYVDVAVARWERVSGHIAVRVDG